MGKGNSMRTYAELTEEWCDAVGLRKVVWNGTTPEYWVSLYNDEELKKAKKNERDYWAFQYRLGIRFNEYPDFAVKVYLFSSHTITELKGVGQPHDLRNVYRLIAGQEMPEK